MRVLFVQSATEVGGAENALLDLVRRLDGHAVSASVALLGFGSGPMAERLRNAGVELISLAGARFRNLRVTARTVAQLSNAIRRGRFDAVVANGGHPLLFARPAAALAGVPCAWWVHGCEPGDALRGSAITWAVALAGADQFVANSQFTARCVSQMFPNAAVSVVSPGIDVQAHGFLPEARATARDKLGIGADENVIGIFGRLQPWKGQHVFLQAAGMLRRRGMRCRFLIVGGSLFGLDPGYADELRHTAERLGLSTDALFLGHREDSSALMSACDVVAHASIVPEPWGLVVAEAMAAGRAVVAARAGGPVEMIEDNVDGILYPPGDAAALCAALLRLVRQPELRERLGRAACQKARRQFDAHYTAEKFAAALARLAGHTVSNGHARPVAVEASGAETLPFSRNQELLSHAALK